MLLVSMFSCQSVENAEKPDNLIPEDKMVNLITDLLKLDASESFSKAEFEKRNVTTKELIFEKYNIDSLQFTESSEYYAEDFKVNRRIYDSVLDRLNKEKKLLDSLVNKQREEEKIKKEKAKSKKSDSLKNKLLKANKIKAQ